MCLLLHSLELPEQKHACVFYRMGPAFQMQLSLFLLEYVGEDGVIDGQAFDIVDLLDQFETHWAAHSSVPGCLGKYM